MTPKKHNGEDDHGDENEPPRRRDEGEEQAPWRRGEQVGSKGGLRPPPKSHLEADSLNRKISKSFCE